MSLMPVLPALPATTVADGTAPGGLGAAAPADSGFLSALAAALGDAAAKPGGRLAPAPIGGCVEDEAGTEGKHPSLPVGDALPTDETAESGAELDPLSLQYQQMAATGVPGAAPLVLSVGTADQVVPGGQLTPGTTPAPAPAATAPAATPGLGATGAAGPVPEAAAQPVPAPPLGPPQPAATPATAAPAGVPAGPATLTQGSLTPPTLTPANLTPATLTPATPAPVAPRAREVAAEPATPGAPSPAPAATGAAPVAPAVVGPAPAALPSSSQQPGAPAAVVHQVFPEITRLSRAGNGTHRLTVTLQPEHLGEVRVTLVVRDGAVRVSIGSDHATEALVQGAPELRRLLEQAGATDARVVIRDASAAGPDAPGAEPRGQRDADGAGGTRRENDGQDGTRERPAGRHDSPPDGPIRPVQRAARPDSAMTPGRLDRLM